MADARRSAAYKSAIGIRYRTNFLGHLIQDLANGKKSPRSPEGRHHGAPFRQAAARVTQAVLACLLAGQTVSAGAGCAGDVDCLSERSIEASGGRQALLGLKSVTRTGTIEFFPGSNGGPSGVFSYRTDLEVPNKIREEIRAETILLDRGTDGRDFWQWSESRYGPIRSAENRRYLEDEPRKANRDILFLQKELDHLKIIPPPSWASGLECLEGSQADRSSEIVCFYETGLMAAIGLGDEHRFLSAWRPVGGIRIPFHLEHFVHGKKAYEVRLTSATINQSIPASRFTMPRHP